MKVISLWQPWASLMASGAKRIETRSWAPRGLRPGQQVAIHAAKRWMAEERELIASDPFFKRYLQLAERRGLWGFDKPPLGCVVAIARFDRAEPTSALVRRISEHEHAFGNYAPFRFGWVFRDVTPLTPPVPLRGQQGLFDWEPVDWEPSVASTSDTPAPAPAKPGAIRVVHCRRDAYDVYIGRPMPRYPELRATGWGNPFKPAPGVDAIAKYREWIQTQPRLLARLPELRGQVLGCWCAPKGGLPINLYGRVCHGEVLAALADGLSLDEVTTEASTTSATLASPRQDGLWDSEAV